MSRRLLQVNRHIQRLFGEILLRDAHLPPDVLVTVSRVDTTGNLKSAHIWLYVLPAERGEEVLQLLKPQMYDLQGALNKELHLNPLPRIRLHLDHGAEHADKIERKVKGLDNEYAEEA